MFSTFREVFTCRSFVEGCFVNVLISFGVNFGFAWGSMSEWGGHPTPASWPIIYAVKVNPEIGTTGLATILGDVCLTVTLLCFLTTLFATIGVQRDVRELKSEPVSDRLVAESWLRYTPAYLTHIFVRAAAMAAFFVLTVAFPTFFLVWAASGDGGVPGFTFVFLKGFWAAALSIPVFMLNYLGAANEQHFSSEQYRWLLQRKAQADASVVSLHARAATEPEARV